MEFALYKSLLLLLFFSILTVSAHEDVSDPETLAVFPHHYAAVPPSQPPAHHHHHHHHQPPVHAPTPTPVPSPSYLPVHPPTQPPSHHHHHHHNHSHSPVHPPVTAPPHRLPTSHPPAPPPSHYPPSQAPGHHHHFRPSLPPTHSPAPIYPPKPRLPRSFISVQGVVYCKSCKYAGVDTLLGATPVAGATVKLVCQNTKYPLVQTGTTDKNGYFFIKASKAITSYAFHKCKVLLVSSPSASSCKKASDLHGGISGAGLRPQKSYIDANKLPFVLYAVGPFAFEPTCPHY